MVLIVRGSHHIAVASVTDSKIVIIYQAFYIDVTRTVETNENRTHS